MVTRFLILYFLMIKMGAFSQRPDALDSQSKMGTLITKEIDFTCVNIDSVNIEMVFYNRINEYPSPVDTLHRDYINVGRIIPIDSFIGLKQTNYTGSFDYGDIYSTKFGKNRFVIISFVDVFIYGTYQEVYFVIFKEDQNKRISVVSSYINENNKPTDDIKIQYRKNHIKLKGKYLRKVKGGSLIKG